MKITGMLNPTYRIDNNHAIECGNPDDYPKVLKIIGNSESLEEIIEALEEKGIPFKLWHELEIVADVDGIDELIFPQNREQNIKYRDYTIIAENPGYSVWHDGEDEEFKTLDEARKFVDSIIDEGM